MFEHFKNWLALASDRRGVTALEYAMIAGIVVVTIAVGFGILGADLSTQFGNIGVNI
jgi:Flp pilus assembly pilin Flp